MIVIAITLIVIIQTQFTTANTTCYVTVNDGSLIGQSVELVTGEGNYCSFKGIPYAQPPIGELRFKAPVPVTPWDGVRNATEHGAVCPQIDILTNVYTPGSEDCLFLNVYTKNLTSNSSVLFFIHGGGFQSGSGNVDSYGPDFFLRDDFDIIVVTINYRLDVLGFLSLGTKEVPGNAGLKDQVLALKWVHDNIQYFGGDPNKVTIMGQSAGSASVALHMISPMSSGLFQRAIAMSGSPFNDWAIPYHPEDRAMILAKQFNCNATINDENLLACFQNATQEQLVNYTFPYVLAGEQITAVITKQTAFGPVIECNAGNDTFLTDNYLDKNFTNINKADVMFGHTNQEGITAREYIIATLFPYYNTFVESFAQKKVCQNLTPDKCLSMGEAVRNEYLGNQTIDVNTMKEFVTYINDANFKYDIVKYYSEFPNNGTLYMYQFSSETSRNYYGNQGVQYGIYGAGHIDDLFYCFDPKSLNFTLDLNSTEFENIDRFTRLIKNFIYTGNPTYDSSFNVTAPQFNKTTMQYLNIGTTNLTVLSLKDESYYSFWTNLLESVGMDY